MKKTLYIFSIFVIALAFFTGCACSDRESEADRLLRLYDLNENGIIDFWEQPFENQEDSDRNTNEDNGFTVHNINSEDEFLAVSFYENSSATIYRLTKNLDFSDKEINQPVDFGGAMLYGNNKSIYNFKLESVDNFFTYALIENASAVYDTNFYLGIQENSPNYQYMSTLHNVQKIDNVKVRGYFDIINTEDIDLSFLHTGDSDVIISNVQIEGIVNTQLDISPVRGSIFNFGGIASRLNANSKITNATVVLESEVFNNIDNFIGGAVAISEGLIEDVHCSVNLTSIVYDTQNVNRIGGVVGQLLERGEIKHCVSDSNITVTRSEEQIKNESMVAVGGVVGESLGSLFYNESKGELIIKDIESIIAGGMIGASFNTYALRNISKVNIVLEYENKPLMSPSQPLIYVAGFAGNAIKGVFESCISIGDVTLELAKSESNEMFQNVNLGLFFFHSSFFVDINSQIGISKMEAQENDTFGDSDTSAEQLRYPNYSPSLNKNIIQGAISINTGDSNPAADTVNYGGYWWWLRTGITLANPEIMAGSNSYASSLTFNNRSVEESKFFPDRTWLKRDTLIILDLGSKFGILDSESNYKQIDSLQQLEFKNPDDLKGSYYKSTAVANSAPPSQSTKYNFHATSIDQLKYLSTYLYLYLDALIPKEMITFEVDNAEILSEENLTETLETIYSQLKFAYRPYMVDDEEVIDYFIFTNAEWERVQNVYEYTVLAPEELHDEFGITNEIQLIMIHQILNKTGKVDVSYRSINGGEGEDRAIMYFTYDTASAKQMIKIDISHAQNQDETDSYTRYSIYLVKELSAF